METENLSLAQNSFVDDQQVMVSIVVACYNHEKFIAQAIESFLMQKTSFKVEILINDDASNDGTVAILKEYEDKFPNLFRIFYQNENQYSKGVKPWFHILFPQARGKYIALCDADDYWIDPLKMQKQVDFLQDNEDYILCYTNTSVVNEKGEMIKEKAIDNSDQTIFTHDDMPLYVPTLTRLFRNIHLDTLPKNDVPGGDTFLVVWQSKFGKIKFMDQITAAYREHQGGIYSSRNISEKYMHLLETRLCCLDIINDSVRVKFYKIIFNLIIDLKCIDNTKSRLYLLKFLKIYFKQMPEFRFREVAKILLIAIYIQMPIIKSYRYNKFFKNRINSI